MPTPQTILVTGATGYIGKHIVLQLLNAGYAVKGSLRDTGREAELHTALRPHLDDPSALERLSVVALNLMQDDGWDAAMQGVDVLMHTASPFPLGQPKDEQDLIRPAVDGAMRAVRAAQTAGITRVIMTSSSAAILSTQLPDGKPAHDEDDWTDLTHPGATAYVKSKTMAERAVWDWQSSQAPEMQVTMINPVFVLGAPLDSNYGSSIELIERLMKGSDPMVPDIGFPCVDVRDIALMHVLALETPNSIGNRIIGADRSHRMCEMAQFLKQDHPQRRIATRVAPNLLMRAMALFDPAIRSIVPMLGKQEKVSNARAQQLLGMKFRESGESIRESGAYLADNNLV